MNGSEVREEVSAVFTQIRLSNVTRMSVADFSTITQSGKWQLFFVIEQEINVTLD